MLHKYVSSACAHEAHQSCPIHCAYCGEQCLCPCHYHVDVALRRLQHAVDHITFNLGIVQSTLVAQGAAMTKELDELTTTVSESTTVQQSAIELLNGLSAKIQELKDDPVALQQLAQDLRSKSSELADAVSANTPSAEE